MRNKKKFSIQNAIPSFVFCILQHGFQNVHKRLKHVMSKIKPEMELFFMHEIQNRFPELELTVAFSEAAEEIRQQ